MPRLILALISVLSHVAAQETRITDPAAVAIGENAKLYELIKAEYIPGGTVASQRAQVLSPRPSPGGGTVTKGSSPPPSLSILCLMYRKY